MNTSPDPETRPVRRYGSRRAKMDTRPTPPQFPPWLIAFIAVLVAGLVGYAVHDRYSVDAKYHEVSIHLAPPTE